jgi:hypothetical protein
MSGKNNVNKDHYTQAGRDRPNTNIVHSDQKQNLTRAQKRIATGEAAAPKGEQPKVQPLQTGEPDTQPMPPELKEALERKEAGVEGEEG